MNLRRRLPLLAALLLVAAYGVARLALVQSASPEEIAVIVAAAAVVVGVVALNGRRVLGRRDSFMASLRASGASLAFHGMTRPETLGLGGAGSVPLTVAAFADRIELWRMPVLRGEPELLRTTRWLDVRSVEVGDAHLSMTRGTGLVVVERGGRRLPVMVVAQGAIGSRLDASETVRVCQQLLTNASQEAAAAETTG